MTIKLGSTDINKVFLGSTEIKKIYLGSTLIFDTTGGGTPTTAFSLGENGRVYANPADLTFTAPTEGSLLIAVMGSRTGTAHSGHDITDDNSGSWSKILGEDQELGDSSNRHAMSVWWRVATATDASGDFDITADTGVSESTHLSVFEVVPNGDYSWSLEESASANSGTGTWESLGSGNTASVSTSDNCVIAIGECRHSTVPDTVSITPVDTDNTVLGGSSNQITSVFEMYGTPQASGVKSVAIDSSNGGDPKGAIACVVFSG